MTGGGIRWARLAGSTTLAIVVTAAAIALAITLLLAILIRDIPNASDAANEFVSDIAVALDVPAEDADALASRVVTEVDDSLLGGSMATAQRIRLVVRILPIVPLAIILAAAALAGRGRRLRWFGWGVGITGLALTVLAWLLDRAGDDAATGFAERAEQVTLRYVGTLLGPAWWIGLGCLGAGVILFLVGRRADTTSATA